MKKRIFVTLIVFVIFSTFIVSDTWAQDDTQQLVITEVNLVSLNQEFWIEIFNPSDVSLILSSMRISGIRTPNVLPRELEGHKVIELKPGERIIICSDIKSFRSKYGDKIRAAELNLLKSVLKGGFVAINHMSSIENSKNVIRFGSKKLSHMVEKIVGDEQVINYADNGMCWWREVLNDGTVSSWKKSNTTPGK